MGHHRRVAGESDLKVLLASLEPRRDARTYVFVTVPVAPPDVDAVVTVHEEEGVTLVVSQPTADEHGWVYSSTMARITLGVHSALEAVGLTAAVSSGLARAGISANMVAGYHHDHVFVPEGDAGQAMAVLRALSAESSLPSGDGSSSRP